MNGIFSRMKSNFEGKPEHKPGRKRRSKRPAATEVTTSLKASSPGPSTQSPSSTPTVEIDQYWEKPYVYRKLDFHTAEIRVLRLNSKDSLRSVEHISLINPPLYIALSYCWGLSEPYSRRLQIQLADGRLPASRNLWTAIQQVRSTEYARRANSFLLWVDAICINQKDNEERSQRVRNMRQIYSRATKVFCWAGTSSGPHELEQLIQFCHPPLFFGDQHKRDKELVIEFFSQPDWKRVWVIQEIAVTSDVTVLWGGDNDPNSESRQTLRVSELDWTRVAKFIKLLHEKTAAEREQLGEPPIHLVEFRDRFMNTRKPIHLLDAIQWTYDTLSSDPRDNIFALLGLCYDGPTFVPVPNYQQSLETILTDMSKTMMRMNRLLDLICMKGMRSSDNSNIPTWVPKWPNIWSGGMTLQESNFQKWHTSFRFNPVLDGSTNDFLKVQGRYNAVVADISSEMRRNFSFDERTPIPYWTRPVPKWIWDEGTHPLRQYLPRSNINVVQAFGSIWMGLTMSLLPQDFTLAVCRSCFSTFWTTAGRGSISSLALIDWMDANFNFKYLHWTLQEWAQM